VPVKTRRCAFALAGSNNALAHAQGMQAPALRERQREQARNADASTLGLDGWLLLQASGSGWAAPSAICGGAGQSGPIRDLSLLRYGWSPRVQGMNMNMNMNMAHESSFPRGHSSRRECWGAIGWRGVSGIRATNAANHAGRAKQLADGHSQRRPGTNSCLTGLAGTELWGHHSLDGVVPIGDVQCSRAHPLVTSLPAGTGILATNLVDLD
jgi:hypothetical protein